MSTGACLGAQGGGCALVILSMSPTKASKVSVKYSKNVCLQWRFFFGGGGVKVSACVYPVCVPAEHGALLSGLGRARGWVRAPRPRSVRSLGGSAPPSSRRVKYTLGPQARLSPPHSLSTPSHEPHVLDGAFNSSPSPSRRAGTQACTHARTHTHPPLPALLEYSPRL